jgi:hypothetical protein
MKPSCVNTGFGPVLGQKYGWIPVKTKIGAAAQLEVIGVFVVFSCEELAIIVC